MATVGMLGVIVLAMYGDRTPYYQDPYTYHQSYTKLTPLGQVIIQIDMSSFVWNCSFALLRLKKCNSVPTCAQNT